ncbi:peptidylprolyl isomerase [Geomonas limicola]|uniref:peptidylprolyl isomerase n=1 Tax=Geomonas limicola TaxID=2740186 RepID=A0A6V8N8V9_9BACT|nr:peptidyl-prolyl cis-trans isomerase [Geomonas limicola]GFO68850.1 peptidylprolyl isomerase [Geomonas limicola]
MPIYRRAALLTLTFLLAGLVGCQKQQGTKTAQASQDKQPKVLAKVNGVPITELDVAFKMSKSHGTPASQQPERTLDDVIKEELLYQQGLKLGLDKDPGYRAQIEKLERQVANLKRIEMTRRVFNQEIAAKINITTDEVKRYYDNNKTRISSELRLGMLSFGTKEAAEEALQKIKNGTSFEEVAGAGAPGHAPAGPRNWDLGFTGWDQIPADFLDAVYRLKPGEVSPVVSMKETGFYLFKLLDTRPNPKADYASMEGIVSNRLREQRVNDGYRTLEEQLKRSAKIERF